MITLWAHHLGHDTGQWCDRCQLPSAVEVTVALESSSGPVSVLAATVCVDCGHRIA